MHKYIRWPGLIGFLAVFGLLVFILYAFLDTWIRIAAEKGMEVAVGAEVNIERVEHQFSPFRVSLKQVQITDPKRPEFNKVEAQHIQAAVQLWPLIMNKIIIDDLAVEGMKFGTQRDAPGEVYREPGEGITIAGVTLPDLPEAPSVDEVLARSPLETTRAIEDLEQAYKAHKDQVKQDFEALPDEARLKEFKARIKALTEREFKTPADVAAAKEELDAIKRDLKAEKQKIVTFKQTVKQAKADISPKLAAVRQAPDNDYDRLKGVLAGDAAAIGDVTEMVFGSKARQWAEYAMLAIDTLGPALKKTREDEEERQRLEGRWVVFDDQTHLPDFWIQQASVSLSLLEHTIDSSWQDITQQHELIGKPTRYEANARATSTLAALQLKGDLALASQGINANQSWTIQQLSLPVANIISNDKLNAQLRQGKLNSQGSVSVSNNVLNGNADIDMQALNIDATGTNNLTKLVASTLSGLSDLAIDADIGGNISAPDFSFTSNLDEKLASAMVNNLSDEQKGKLAELEQRLNDKMAKALGEKESQYAQWLKWEEVATGDLSSVEDMLETKLQSLIEKEKDKLKDKLLDKLFGDT